MEIRVDVANAEAISRAFLQAPAMVLDELELTMENVTLYLMREAQENTPTAAGTLRSGWTTQVDVIAQLDSVFGRVTNPLPYALPVELGTKPHFPPLAPLINWVEQKLNLYGDEAEGAARGIQRKIGRYGSPGFGMAHYALRDGRSTIAAEFEECAQRITARLAGGGAGGNAPGSPA
jgi:hypothetical protein